MWGLPTCPDLTTLCRPPRRSILHHLNNIGKIADLGLLVLTALQTVTFLVCQLAALLRVPTPRPARLLRRQRVPAPLARLGFGLISRRLFRTHAMTS